MEIDNNGANYITEKAKDIRSNDSCAAKAWVLTGKTMFPRNFYIQLESYKLEKEMNNYEEAAKCFNIIGLAYRNQSVELWNEINELMAALRATSGEVTAKQEFYLKMFNNVTSDVQQEMLLLLINQADNSLSQCKFLITILKKFPQASISLYPRLLELIIDGIPQDPQNYQELLAEEALPLICHKTPDMPCRIVSLLFTTIVEYYIRQILDDEVITDSNDAWKKIFNVALLTGKILRWKTFLPFNKCWGQNIYWDKLIEIVSTSPPGSPQVLCYATTLFIYSLHCYIKNCNTRTDDGEMNHVLVEGFTEWSVERSDAKNMEPPQISMTTATSKEISKAFVHAAQCWQLLNTEQFQSDFSRLLLSWPLASWISRFLFDLAIYFGHQQEAKKLMTEMQMKSTLVHNLQLLSLNLLHGPLSFQGFECVIKILAELPMIKGQLLDHLTLKVPRHMIFLPLTQRAVVQYCTNAILTSLSRKLYEPNCPDQILGDLLVLLQLEYPRETLKAQQIFSLISARRCFAYHNMQLYIVNIDFVEEFMHLWHAQNEDFSFDFSNALSPNNHGTRRISTRGIDKGVREDFRLTMRTTIGRCNENLTSLITTFINQEQMQLMRTMFRGDPANF